MGLSLPLPLVTAKDERDQTLRQRLVTSEAKRVGITMHPTRKGYSTSPNSCPQYAVAQRKLTYARRGKETLTPLSQPPSLSLVSVQYCHHGDRRDGASVRGMF